MVKSISSCLLTALCVQTFGGQVTAQVYSFTSITFPGANETLVFGINDAGVVVGTYGSQLDVTAEALTGNTAFFYDGQE